MAKRRVRVTKADMVKRTKRAILHTISLGDLEGSLSDVQRFISELSDYDTGCDQIMLEVDSVRDYGYCCEITVLNLVGTTQETDKELETRIAKLKEAKRKNIEREEAADKKLYKQLKRNMGIQRGPKCTKPF